MSYVNFEVVSFRGPCRTNVPVLFLEKVPCHERIVKNKLSWQIKSAKKNVFFTVWLAADRQSDRFERWKHPNIRRQNPAASASLHSLPPPWWPSDLPRVFLKDDSLFANTWALKAGTWPRGGEKQTRQVSAFLSMKNKRGEIEAGGSRNSWGDAEGWGWGASHSCSPAERKACFVALRHVTSRTSSEVAVCCETVGGGGGGGLEGWKGEEGGGSGPKGCGHERGGRLSSV